jgi:hypothetical protein
MSDAYRHKDVWTRRGTGFAIEVSRHEGTPIIADEGPHRWAVYAYVYPEHPHFAAFAGEEMFQPATQALPLHAYPSFFRVHRDNDGEVCSYQVGADYHHLHDEHYTRMATREDAGVVFRDADELWEWMSQRAKEPTPTKCQSDGTDLGRATCDCPDHAPKEPTR